MQVITSKESDSKFKYKSFISLLIISILSDNLLYFTESKANLLTSFCISTPIILALVLVDNIKGIGALPHPISNISVILERIVTKFASNTESN